ncbi:hypothetical protein, partial [Lactobacillus delbrueckii]|uniref:hypothetical protein n=1 Tax=Lactobacillus delbrueckii TaxID=1584 RepID=UPI003A83FC5D
LTPKVVGGKLPARIGSCRAKQESDGSLALFCFPWLLYFLPLLQANCSLFSFKLQDTYFSKVFLKDRQMTRNSSPWPLE